MISLADLKADGVWSFRAHLDGSDKDGRFWMNVYTAEVGGRRIEGYDQRWRNGQRKVGYKLTDTGETVHRLVDLLPILNQPYTAGDDPEARDD